MRRLISFFYHSQPAQRAFTLRAFTSALSLLFVPFIFAATLSAQSVRWDPPGGTLGAGQVVQLNLVFSDCELQGNLALPNVAGLEFGQPSQGTQTSFSIVNGQTTNTRQVIFSFPARAAAGQSTVQIPAFDVVTDKGRQHVAAASFTVGAATVGGSGGVGVSLDSVAQSHFTLPRSVWAGEVFPLVYSLDILERYAYQLGGNPEWNSAPLLVEDDWTKTTTPAQSRATRRGETYIVISYPTRAFAKAPGDFALNPATQLTILQTGVQGLGLFAQRTVDRYAITSAPATLTVKPLPTPAPPAFTGAVGEFTFDAKVVPATVAVGEPITWTLTLGGTGNWPDITTLPRRNVSTDFRVVSPQAKHTAKEHTLFDGQLAEDIVLIPTKPGLYTLGPVTFACFDPKSGQYKTLTTEKFTVTVTGPAAPAPTVTFSSPTPGNDSASTASDAASQSAKPNPSPAPPTGLPRDPLPAAKPATALLTMRDFFVCLLSPFACLLPFWLALAGRRAALTDPRRLERAARQRLTTTLASLSTTSDRAQIAVLLQAWRRDTATLWQLLGAEPTPAALGDVVWSTLWAEADRALFGERFPLPSDWCSRAEAALATKRVPSFQPLTLFLPRNLFPSATRAKPPLTAGLSLGSPSSTPLPVTASKAAPLTLLFLLLSVFLPPPVSRAAEAPDAYRATDFPAAEKSWRVAIATVPVDWAAHHNLSLALAQQNRWAEAAGHALAAFAQQPQNPAVRWQLDLALKNAGWVPDPARPFLEPGPVAALAARASPAQWQRLAVLAALLTAAALTLLFLRSYGARARWLGPAAGTAFLTALLLAVAASVSLRLYGPLTDARAVLVWRAGVLRSIPTEADTAQKTTPLAPGLVAMADKTFLGWTRLAFPTGQTGWVRQEEIISLW